MTEAKFAWLSRALSAGSVFSLVASFVAALSSQYGELICLAVTSASVLLMLAGYALQLLVFKVLRYRRPSDEKSYESTVR